jgi:hypothetical protein
MAGCRYRGSGELVFTAQNIIRTTVAAFGFLGGIVFYLRWSYLGWREGQRLSGEAFLKDRPLGDDRERDAAWPRVASATSPGGDSPLAVAGPGLGSCRV